MLNWRGWEGQRSSLWESRTMLQSNWVRSAPALLHSHTLVWTLWIRASAKWLKCKCKWTLQTEVGRSDVQTSDESRDAGGGLSASLSDSTDVFLGNTNFQDVWWSDKQRCSSATFHRKCQTLPLVDAVDWNAAQGKTHLGDIFIMVIRFLRGWEHQLGG
jgi:hypothetical protein